MKLAKSKNKYYNPNPLKKEIGDCVVRALCLAEGLEWDEVYKELCEIGLELKAMPNDVDTYTEYLARHGWTRNPISVKKGSKRPTVNEMAKRSKTEGVMVCRIANHLVTVKDGFSWDLWDCGESSLYVYWSK